MPKRLGGSSLMEPAMMPSDLDLKREGPRWCQRPATRGRPHGGPHRFMARKVLESCDS